MPYDRKYLGYIDVLGYKEFVNNSINEKQQFSRLYSVYESLLVEFQNSRIEYINQIQVNSFSDSFFLCSNDFIELCLWIKSLYKTAYLFQSESYEPRNDWIPFLRAGIVHDYVAFFRDASLMGRMTNFKEEFVNPVGQGVIRAYQLAEESGLSGMRIFVKKDIMKELELEIKEKSGVRFYEILYDLIDYEKKNKELNINWKGRHIFFEVNENIVELDWFEELLLSDSPPSQLDVLAKVKDNQFKDKKIFRHFNETLKLIEKSIIITSRSLHPTTLSKIKALIQKMKLQ